MVKIDRHNRNAEEISGPMALHISEGPGWFSHNNEEKTMTINSTFNRHELVCEHGRRSKDFAAVKNMNTKILDGLNKNLKSFNLNINQSANDQFNRATSARNFRLACPQQQGWNLTGIKNQSNGRSVCGELSKNRPFSAASQKKSFKNRIQSASGTARTNVGNPHYNNFPNDLVLPKNNVFY
jgi:hypothetical protein